ncbi:MAG: hypothetical protein ACRC10_05125 [Thermoguttaceae bacterium]
MDVSDRGASVDSVRCFPLIRSTMRLLASIPAETLPPPDFLPFQPVFAENGSITRLISPDFRQKSNR